jgi:beta-lactamase class A
MRRYAGRASHLVVIFAFTLIAAAACASPSSDAPPTTATTGGHSSTSASGPTTSAPKPKPKSPFARLAGYIASRPGTVTAAVLDRTTGRFWVFHPRVKEDTASIVKVEIMATILKKAQDAGSEPPGDEQSLMTTMIENSDNDAATALLHDVGGPSAVQGFDNSIGMTGTTVSTQALIPGSTLPGWGLTTTTARDEVRLVSTFAFHNTVLSDASRSYGLNLMEHVESDQAWGVSGGVPPGVTVALKNGWLPLDLANNTDYQIDSIGWIHGDGRDYVLAVLSSGNPTMDDGIATIGHISAEIYSELG